MYADLSGLSIDIYRSWRVDEAVLQIRRNRLPTSILLRGVDILDLIRLSHAFLNILCMDGSEAHYSTIAINLTWSPTEAGQERNIIPMVDMEAASWALSLPLVVTITVSTSGRRGDRSHTAMSNQTSDN